MHLAQQDCNRLPADRKGGLHVPVCTSEGKEHSVASGFAPAADLDAGFLPVLAPT